ncbi:Nonsense-mediated mRNA decay NMD3 like protein [Thermococcus sp. GR7]|uniref:60S ribosomal export protein NMD3 n=1 Tax=unclassified Thermococcus TaxID=2627626 RepID=UPI00143168FD|nr:MULTISPECIES: 60S ribosomal export protein NMD3 [unclassified Thermococcus]NJE46284.1 Nonsense-mediated mRNA decay NMD3 like protein [Thermococcus sp. GR7]NJE79234.1 Nonsense-mediated mRNA decay NMD3 like protein [Thermococcus sp. GR4]NJF23837.1 Nonsense-mediated mRNA decay NMD3 like protein [Thermococcus sp. GR5]
MSERFCYRCGISESEGGPLVIGLCQVCFRKENPVLLIEREINTELCQNCGSYKKRGVWVDPSTYELEELIFEVAEGALLEELGDSLDERVRSFEVVSMEELGEINDLPVGAAVVAFQPVDWHIEYFPAIITYEVRVKARIHELQRELHDEVKYVTVYVRQTVCPRCQKFLGGYFEAILQVRAEDRPLTEAERKAIGKLVEEKVDEIMRKDRMGFIQDTIEKEEGLDFYMGSTSSARKLAQAIKERFGGTISEAYELVGMDRLTSKEVYRTSVSIRIPKFQKGDIVEDRRGNVYEVERVDGKGMSLRNLSTNESEHRDWKTVKREGIDWVEYEKSEAMVTSITPNEVQLMDMETYETYELDKPGIDLREGEIYRMVEVRGRKYFLRKKE